MAGLISPGIEHLPELPHDKGSEEEAKFIGGEFIGWPNGRLKDVSYRVYFSMLKEPDKSNQKGKEDNTNGTDAATGTSGAVTDGKE